MANEEAKGHRDNTALYPPTVKNAEKSTAPAPPQLQHPEFMAKVPTATNLKWAASETADVYHLQVATDANFKWLQVDDHNVKQTEFSLKNLEPGKKYYWRVAAWKNGNMPGTNKSFFASSSFTTVKGE